MFTSSFRLLAGFFAIVLLTVLSSWGTNNTFSTKAVSHHQITINNKAYNYTATAGHLPVKNGYNKWLANIFYTAYTVSSNADRPLTFVFNGGPGSASIWLHMGSLAPVRVQGSSAEYSSNPQTWLPFTDLVFIDPVGTGYSRAADVVNERQFYSFNEDIDVIARFVSSYLHGNKRKSSAIYLAGESYGGARAVGLAAKLKRYYNIKVDGLTLISPALNYENITFKTGNDDAYPLYLPTYALVSQFHQQLAAELQALAPQVLATRVKAFAESRYLNLLKGDTTNFNDVVDTLSYYTGISKKWLKQHNARITDHQFARLVLNEDGSRTGIFDARVAGIDKKGDPSEATLRSTYPKALSKYFKSQLGFKSELPYRATITVSDWNFGSSEAGYYLNVVPALKQLLKEDAALKVHVVGGYYDLATPVETIKNTVAELDSTQVSSNYYYAGHMIYTDDEVNAQFYADSKAFYTAVK